MLDATLHVLSAVLVPAFLIGMGGSAVVVVVTIIRDIRDFRDKSSDPKTSVDGL